MKRQRTLTFFAVVATMALPALAGEELKPRDLTPVTWMKAATHPPVEIVREGRARAVVYVVDPRGRGPFVPERRGQRPPVLKQLVDELVETVRLRTGAAPQLVEERPPPDRSAIVIGDCDDARQAGIDAGQLPVEGFVVKTAPGRVYLVGSTRGGNDSGTAWAIADFLERLVGVRWYWPSQYSGRSVARRTTLTIPPLHYCDQPVFPYRTMYQDWYWLQARSFDEQLLPMPADVLGEQRETLWMGDHFRLMRQSKSWPDEAVQHGARVYEFIHKVPKTDERLFALREDGSRNFATFCYSAPQTLACYLENLERAWDGDRKGVILGGIRPSSITVWAPLDIGARSLGSACHCSACRQTLAKGGEELLMGRFIQRLCEHVKQRWPDKKVLYVPWVIPDCPELDFPDNLVVSHLNLDVMGLLREPAIRGLEESRLRKWGATSGGDVHTWIDFASPSDWTYGPAQFPHLVQEFYTKNRDCLAGTSVLSYGGACFITAAPTYYVWNRVLWDPELDVDAVLDEMCRRLFGAGAKSARELMRIECERWEQTPLSRPLRVGENRIPPRLFREIWPPEVVARMKTLRDRSLTEIEQSGDAAARRSFLYWTWEFDAFVEYAEMADAVMTRNAEVTAAPGGSDVEANEAAEARFRGGPGAVNQVRIANVHRQDAPVAGQSEMQFDLSWGGTWRAKWTEPAEANVTGRNLPIESWNAAWVFAKFLTENDRENNNWRHVTLSTNAGDHAVPAAAAMDVGLSGDKGMGVFIYRAEAGHGPLDLKDVKLRWLHGADGVAEPATAELKVFAVEMVYVPRGAFAVGSGGAETGSFTDGCWTEGPSVSLLIDVDWSRSAAEGSNARRLGAAPGRLWGTSGGTAAVGPEGTLCDAFPTGYEAFYCMRYEVTRQQFADFLNTITEEIFDSTSAGDDQHAGAHYTAAGRYSLSGVWPHFEPARPHQACNLLSWWDGAKFANWAGLRPMTELEYEKACRGLLEAVPNEYAWGTATIASAPYTVAGEGTSAERIGENYRTTVGNAVYEFTMPDFYGGAARGGVSAVPGSPMRVGVFATAGSGRVAAGASYWGIMELSGNVREQVVSVSEAKGRAFQGTHGAGTPDVPKDWPEADYARGTSAGENDAVGSGLRGGFFGDTPSGLGVSDRSRATYRPGAGSFSVRSRQDQNGFRAVRTAPRR